MLKNTLQKLDLVRSAAVEIPVDYIRPRKFTVRNSLQGIDSLAKSISLIGMLQPLVVRNTPLGYELVCGERRLNAARLAGLEFVPCTVVELSDSMAMAAALVENIQRQELYFLDNSEHFAVMSEKFKLTPHKLAVLLGTSLDCINKTLAHYGLDENQRTLFRNSGLTASHADILSKTPEHLKDELLNFTIKNSLSAAQMREHLHKMLYKEKLKRSYTRRSKPLSDLKLFFNSVEKAVKIIRLAGVRVGTEKFECRAYIEYKIRIEK